MFMNFALNIYGNQRIALIFDCWFQRISLTCKTFTVNSVLFNFIFHFISFIFPSLSFEIKVQSRQLLVERGFRTEVGVHTCKSFRNPKNTEDFPKKCNQITEDFCITRTN